ncbi:hypothetical protein ACWGTI_21295 [Mesorhizobium sp. ArgA1]
MERIDVAAAAQRPIAKPKLQSYGKAMIEHGEVKAEGKLAA